MVERSDREFQIGEINMWKGGTEEREGRRHFENMHDGFDCFHGLRVWTVIRHDRIGTPIRSRENCGFGLLLRGSVISPPYSSIGTITVVIHDQD